MNSFEFKVASDFRLGSTRENGRKARTSVLGALERSASVTLDFTGAVLSPSFADELVGGLILRLGKDEFRRRLQIVGLDESARALLNHIAATRLKQSGGTAKSKPIKPTKKKASRTPGRTISDPCGTPRLRARIA
jgi:hypothetical protein